VLKLVNSSGNAFALRVGKKGFAAEQVRAQVGSQLWGSEQAEIQGENRFDT